MAFDQSDYPTFNLRLDAHENATLDPAVFIEQIYHRINLIYRYRLIER